MKAKRSKWFWTTAGSLNILPAVLTCVLLGTQAGPVTAADCNPRIDAILKNARKNGDSITILALPDLGPLDASDIQSRGYGRIISLYVKRKINLNVRLAMLNQHRDVSKHASNADGLIWFQGTEITGFGKVETYFASDGGVVTDIVKCNPPRSAPSPSCQHLINHGLFSIQANYGRTWLPKWRDIRNTLTAAVDRCNPP
jgi:hypothetical protein